MQHTSIILDVCECGCECLTRMAKCISIFSTVLYKMVSATHQSVHNFKGAEWYTFTHIHRSTAKNTWYNLLFDKNKLLTQNFSMYSTNNSTFFFHSPRSIDLNLFFFHFWSLLSLIVEESFCHSLAFFSQTACRQLDFSVQHILFTHSFPNAFANASTTTDDDDDKKNGNPRQKIV